jgi:hypothetical protein
MNVRLIKPGMSAPVQKHDQPIREIPIADTIQSWVREFHASRADRTRLEFLRLRNTGKT